MGISEKEEVKLPPNESASPFLAVPAFGLVFPTRVMTELKTELSDLNPRSMLDFGSGPGTAALAVWGVWGMEGGSVVDEDGEERWEEGESNVDGCERT